MRTLEDELAALFGIPVEERHPQHEEIILMHILKELRKMALDLTKLNAAITASVAATEALLAAKVDPAVAAAEQKAVDDAAAVLEAETAKAVA